MCDLSQITPSIVMALAGVILAIASIGTAIVLNNGFCTAPGSPIMMLIAGGACLAAVAGLVLLNKEITEYYECMNSPKECYGELTSLLNASKALITVLSIQATACFVAAGIALIPWVGAAPMYVILAALITQMGLIPSLYIFVRDFVVCVQEAAEKSPINAILIGTTIVSVAAIGITISIRRNLDPINWKRR